MLHLLRDLVRRLTAIGRRVAQVTSSSFEPRRAHPSFASRASRDDLCTPGSFVGCVQSPRTRAGTTRATLAALSAAVLAGFAALAASPAQAARATSTQSTHAVGWAALPARGVHLVSRARNPLYGTGSESSADQPPAGTVTINYDIPTPEADLFLQVVHPTDASGKIIPAPVILSYTPYSF